MNAPEMIEVMTKYMADTRRIIQHLSGDDSDCSVDAIVEETGINEETVSIIMAVLYASGTIIHN